MREVRSGKSGGVNSFFCGIYFARLSDSCLSFKSDGEMVN